MTLIIPGPISSSGWEDVYNADFSQEASDTVARGTADDTFFTLAGVPWRVINAAADTVGMTIINGEGIRIRPSGNLNWNTSPGFYINLGAFASGNWWASTGVRALLYVSASSGGAPQGQAMVSLHGAYAYGLTSGKVAGAVAFSPMLPSGNFAQGPVVSSDDVVGLEMPSGLYMPNGYHLSKAYSGNMDFDDARVRRVTGYVGTIEWQTLTGGLPINPLITIGAGAFAGNSGAGGDFTLARLRIQRRRE
jgi:hypothetical protein